MGGRRRGARLRPVRMFEPPGPGRLVLCSDGLSRYLTGPVDLAPVATEEPGAAARRLTQFALDAGGVDNIAVVVLPYPPDDPGEHR
ncbi:hypothetical protein ACFQX7_40135 [Luedemannella flava]